MSNNRYKILVVEDERNIQSFIKTILEANDYKVITAFNGEQAMMLYGSHIPDLVILDLGLPDMDGLEFIRMVRNSGTTPIIVLSARSEEKDKVDALDLGANDYMVKPFSTAELLARIRAALRNYCHSTFSGKVPGEKFVLEEMVIDYDKRMVTVADQEIRLTQTEYNILVLLAEHSGKVLTYAAIIREIWGNADSGSVKKLQVNMANIRKKIGSKPGDNRYIINELGVGYRMCEAAEEN